MALPDGWGDRPAVAIGRLGRLPLMARYSKLGPHPPRLASDGTGALRGRPGATGIGTLLAHCSRV